MPPKHSRKKVQATKDTGHDSSVEVDKTDHQIVVHVDVHQEDDNHSVLESVASSSESGSMGGRSCSATPVSSIAQASEASEDIDNTPESPKDSKKKKRIVSYMFTDEQEKELGEWLRDEECLYDKRHKRYKDAQYKQNLLQTKADSYTPTCTCEY
jgi:hypothetical protein